MRVKAWLKASLGLAAAAVLAMGLSGARAQASDLSSPIGNWRTIDDRTNKVDGSVQIYERDGLLFGRITGIADPKLQAALCHNCSGYAQNQPVMGLVVIQNMRPDDGRWIGGTILNPQDGQVYHCKMHLGPDGQTLIVRGYIGTPMLGRTQTWQRLPG